jgi:hypothetical protein
LTGQDDAAAMGTLGNIAGYIDAAIRTTLGKTAHLMTTFWTLDNHLTTLLFIWFVIYTCSYLSFNEPFNA